MGPRYMFHCGLGVCVCVCGWVGVWVDRYKFSEVDSGECVCVGGGVKFLGSR